jgi:C1A family cysteine protease
MSIIQLFRHDFCGNCTSALARVNVDKEIKMKHILSALIILMMVAGTGIPACTAQDADNWVSRLSDEEFQQLLGFIPPETYNPLPPDPSLKDRSFPDRYDWRELNGVTTVKNQGQCGSCWAFAAAGVLESQVYLDTGVEPDYSEQQLVDCTPGAYGCNGGNYETAWEYLKDPGFTLESDYPYQAQNMTCLDGEHEPFIRVLEYQHIDDSVDSIKAALMDYGPVACSIGANNNLKAYSGGCYEDSSTTGINHAVIIVGWDDNMCPNGSWIVKNSWGSSWGDNGFFTINRGDVHIGEYPAIVTYEEIPPVRFKMADYLFDDAQDGVPEAGETVDLLFSLENFGRENASGITAELETTHSGITITQKTISFPDIPAKSNSGLSEPFSFTVGNIEPAERIDFTITISYDGGEIDLELFCYSGPLYTIFSSQFDVAGDEGWTHGFTRRKDNWTHGMHPADESPGLDPAQPHSGEYMWGNNLEHGGMYLVNMSNYLNSPVFDCTGMSNIYLSFWRWLTVEESEYDQATILVNGEEIWRNAYSGHHIDKQWVRCVYDISEQAAGQESVQITFALDTDQGLNFGGWNIDDFSLFTGVDDTFKDTFKEPIVMTVETSLPVYQAGDFFELIFTVNNYQESREVNEWLLLDVYGQYWFWPSWSAQADFRTRTLTPRCSMRESILSFDWPEISGHADGLKFWAAIIDAQSGDILDYGMTEWGY